MKQVIRFCIVLCLVVLLASCTRTDGFQWFVQPTATPIPTMTPTTTPSMVISGLPQGTDGYPWWNDTTFYEIFVRSFFDSNDDGIGDFNGITLKLDYLNDGDPNTTTDLGITGIWLMPINPSPSYHGYDVEDYTRVNADYGSMDDFKQLLAEAHARGIRVIIDLVINHTSNTNPWFVEAIDPQSPYHDWYIWSDHDPGYRGSWGQQVWYPMAGKFYYATFGGNMPDLNFRNPAVVAEMEKVMRFWLSDVGVDGFRLDAAKHIVEEGSVQANTDSTHRMWESFHTFYKGINPEAMTVGEVWDETLITAAYLQGDQFDLSFEFKLQSALIEAVNKQNSFRVSFQTQFSYSQIPEMRFATFLANHDQERVMNQVGEDEEKCKVAASLLLTSPGVPFLYYGEEVGMQGQKPDPLIRAPMQWTSGQAAGFSNVAAWQPAGANFSIYNVAGETNDAQSILSHYRTLIQLRNRHSALRVGDYHQVNSGSNSVYALLRQSEGETVLVLINLSGQAVSNYQLSLENSSLSSGEHIPILLMGEGETATLSADAKGGFFRYVPLTQLGAYETVILQILP